MPALPSITHLQIDLATDDLEPIWRFVPQLIFHLAATFERSEESPEFWLPNWQDNVVLSHRLAEGVRADRGVEALVFASSYLIYDPRQYLSVEPHADAVALREDARQDPRNLCGAAKLYAEKEYKFARDHLAAASRVTCARIFRVYGRGSRDVVSRWVRAALAGEALSVFQPENRFDYVYARDVAEALLRLATVNGADGVVNLGTGQSHSIAELVDTLRAALPDVEIRTIEEDRDAPYEASRADTGRLNQLIGWVPQTDLASGIREIVEWERACTHAGGPA
jgi:nucleoside-diphosphate-sugar epimerase